MLAGPARGEVGRGAAHAKLVLFGEHVVLYGRPAIALPIPSLTVTAEARVCTGPVLIETTPLDTGWGDHAAGSRVRNSPVSRVAVTAICEQLGIPDEGLRVLVDSAVPPGRGLGSSAASSAAIIAAIAALHGRTLDRDTMFDLVQRAEHVAHGKASGVDARTVVGTGGPLWFHDGTTVPLRVAALHPPPVLVIADTGVDGRTSEAVAAVRRRLGVLGAEGERLLDHAGELTTRAALDLADGRVTELGVKMTAMHEVLVRLGVSCPEIEALVTAATAAGAVGAKLSGGGLGGCVVALAADHEAAARTAAAMTAAAARTVYSMTLEPVST